MMFNAANFSTKFLFCILFEHTALSSIEDSSSGINFNQDFLKGSGFICFHAFDIFFTTFRMSNFLKSPSISSSVCEIKFCGRFFLGTLKHPNPWVVSTTWHLVVEIWQ